MGLQKTSKIQAVRLVAVIGLLLLAGCAWQKRGGSAPQAGIGRICLDSVEKVDAMRAAEDVLAGMRFTIEKSDADAGLIRTHPLPGAQFFELWRRDSVGSLNSAEANLHSIRRTVQLGITENDKGLCINCDVKTERLNLPEQEVTSSARAYQLFSKSGRSRQTMQLNTAQRAQVGWVDLGSDSRLAAEVLQRIQRQISKSAIEK